MRCQSEGCKNKARPGRKICNTCKWMRYVLMHPINWEFNRLRKDARKRGIGFELTLEEFTKFCNITKYIELKGQRGDDYAVDRIKSYLPYKYDNIRMIKVKTNTLLAVGKLDPDWIMLDYCPY